jgi:DNA-binding NarL/FixJ family response regulator
MGQVIQVLIAEDGIQARAALRALLCTWPEIEIVGEVANGQEAVDFVAAQQPNVVLMDIEMPIMDGLEATRLIKTRWPDIAVIVLTMYPEYRSRAIAAGADHFFSKAALPEEWLPWLSSVTTGDAR